MLSSIGNNAHSQTNTETVKIGFLVRDQKDLAIVQTAELAIAHANAQGSENGKKFELIVKYCDGPWGVTSKQTVDLIYDEKVSLVVDALDGRNAHLAEQVTAKAHVVLLSTLSSDPTLSRAYVPWYFRMVPDDKQQAQSLITEIYKYNKNQKVALIALEDYDGKKSAESMSEMIIEKAYPRPVILSGLSENELMQSILKDPWTAVVFAGNSNNSASLVKKITGAKPNIKIYSFLNVLNFNHNFQTFLTEKVVFPYLPDSNISGPKAFETEFKNEYGSDPNPVLAYVYDGVLLAVAAVRKYGEDPEVLRKNFKSMTYKGITGEVEFDSIGNRLY